MRSGWFFGTQMWADYLYEYAKTRPECLLEWKSSPLASDHDFSEYVDEQASQWERKGHLSQVIDLRTHKWSDVRKSYRGLINKSVKSHLFFAQPNAYHYSQIHMLAFGKCRNEKTYAIQEQWIKEGHAFCLTSLDQYGDYAAAALWIVYKGCAYYASGPSLHADIQH